MEKKNFHKVHPTKMRHYGFLFLKTFPGGDQAGFSLDFDHVWGGEDQNLHYGCAYTPHY